MNHKNVSPDDVEDVSKARKDLKRWISKRKDILDPYQMCLILAAEASYIAFLNASDITQALETLGQAMNIGYQIYVNGDDQ